jgi:hypothetical protein
MKHLQIIVESQVNILVQPWDHESHEQVAAIINEAQKLAQQTEKPVVILDKWGGRAEIKPPISKK